MKRVLASGVFDVLHPGHLHYLREAKACGDYLVVVVTSDGHAQLSKRPPLHSENHRAELLRALEMVDGVIIGADPYDLVETTQQANPDVIALGYDQRFDEGLLQSELAAAGLRVEVVRASRFPTPQTGEILTQRPPA